MRRFFIWLFLGFAILIFARLFIANISPFKEDSLNLLIQSQDIGPEQWEQLNEELRVIVDRGLIFEYLSTNAYIGVFLVSLSIFCFFTAIHLFVDKLFFKNFFEKASVFDATRRALLFCLALVGSVALLLYDVQAYVVLAAPLLALTFEVLFTRYLKEPLKVRVQKINQLSKTKNSKVLKS